MWVAFHRRSAEIYGAVAQVDDAHGHEAARYAGLEIRQAREIEDRLTSDQ
jgi:hypothetical protein